MSVFRCPLRGLAVVAAMAALLVVSGCGRKGPLDPPPGASIEGVPQANMPDLMSKREATPIGGQASGGNAGVGPDGQPQAPIGPDKRILLDGLLN